MSSECQYEQMEVLNDAKPKTNQHYKQSFLNKSIKFIIVFIICTSLVYPIYLSHRTTVQINIISNELRLIHREIKEMNEKEEQIKHNIADITQLNTNLITENEQLNQTNIKLEETNNYLLNLINSHNQNRNDYNKQVTSLKEEIGKLNYFHEQLINNIENLENTIKKINKEI